MATAKSTLEKLIDLPEDQAILLISPHGMGKSSIVKEAAKILDANLYDIRLSQCEVGDIKGLPFLNEETRTTEFFKPRWWPRDMSSKGFLFFDELNRANQETQQAVFEIVLDRQLDGDSLPEDWRVVAAINGDDRYQVSELDHALFDRFYVISFDPTVDEWLEWAESNGIHSSIRQFIIANDEHLDPPSELINGTIYPSRRSWDRFNSAMNKLDLWKNKDEAKISEIAAGWLGRAAAIKFTTFFTRDFKLISGKDLIENYDEVEKDFVGLCGDITVVATISNSIIKYAGTIEGDLTENQLDNIKKCIYALPKEVGIKMWMGLSKIPSFRKRMTTMKEEDPKLIKYIASLYADKNS